MRQIKSDLLKDFPKNNPKLMGVRTGRRVLVISNYLPYTVKPGNVLVADATSTTVSRHGGTEMRPVLNLRTALDDLNSPLIDPHEMGLPSSYGRYGDRRSSLGSMVAFREEDDARHPPDYSTPIPSPTVRPLRTKRTGSELTGSSASSLDTFMLDISPSPWKVAPFFGGNSGLHNAINAAKEICQDRLWVGTLPTDLPKDPSERNNVLNKLRHSYNSLVVELPAGDKQHPGNYYRYCKRVMWPIFHNMLPDHHLALQSGTNQDDWESYVQLNKAFADSVIAEYQPGDIIWVNDYHLMLVPQLVRAVLPDATMGFFLHVPFPTSEIFRCLPVRQEILQGILAADLIGFQTYGYARHFFQSCTRILGYSCTPRGVQMEDRLVTVGIFPIGIVPGSIERKLQSLEVSEIAEQLCEKYTGKMIIVSRDKVDPVKGIREKLLGFSQFLEDYPEWRGRVVLIQVAVTGQDRCLQNISRIAAGINARFECLATCYTPVVLIAQDVSFPHYLALLSVANVCLITSLRDGMNLTSHEFVLCQKDRNHGPLIISEFAGTSTTFSAALREVADTLKEALEMNPEERQTRHAQLYRHVTTNTGKLWTDSFLTELVAEADMERLRQSMVAPLLDESAFIKDYAMVAPGRKRVILIDYDAILPSFKNISYSHETIKSLKNCLALISAEDTGNIVVLVSERSAEQLEHTLAGLENIILCAENGCCARFPGQPGWRNLVAEPDPLWWERVQTILEYYTERTPGAWIEHKRAAYVWHYDHADAVFGARQAKECQAHVQDALGANCPVHAVAVRKRLQIRLRTVSQRQAVGSMLKATLTGDLDVGFVAVFMRTRDDEDLFQYCREVVGRSLGLLPSSSPVLPIGSPLNPIESSSSSPLKRWATFETDRPLYICAVGETLTLQADQRVVSACSLLRLLTRAHLEHN